MIKKTLIIIMSMALLTMVLAATGPASAQSTPQECLLNIILSSTPNNTFTSGSMTFDGKAVVTISDDVINVNTYYGWQHYGSDMSHTMTVSAAGGYTITRCRFYSHDSSAFDEEAPFEVVLSDGKAYVNGNSIGEYGLKRIDVYGYATPKNRTLKCIPDGWAVEADGQSVAVTDGAATIADGARVRLIPPTAVKPTVDRVTVTPEDKMQIPLTLEALTNGTIVVNNPKAGMQYSLNGGDKTSISSNTTINVAEGDKVQFYGNGTNITSYNGTKISGGTAQTKTYGNIMSLLDEENFATATTISTDWAFFQIFQGNTMLTDASGLLLPATTLSLDCYSNMFSGCTSLTTAPALPAMTLADYCYAGMFRGCSSLSGAPVLPATTLANNCYINMFYGCAGLTTVPALPATTLANKCYYGMFNRCTSLTTAPTLPATTLFEYCYREMFEGCTSLSVVPALPATTLADGCYYDMFYGCTSLETAPALPDTALANYCYNRMFYGCTGLTTAPTLPATTLANDCYAGMFSRCTSLAVAPALPATTLADGCYSDMFNGCTSLETAPALPATALAPSCYSAMFSGCTTLVAAPALPATTLAKYCYRSMFGGCTSLTTAPVLPATTLVDGCYYYMFANCTSLTTAPVLPATTLVYGCYYYMFANCSNLSSVTCLATSGINQNSSTYHWLNGVADDGTFYRQGSTYWPTYNIDGIPSGWTLRSVE